MNDIVLMALRAEAPELFEYQNVFETGVGKVNAAITAAKLIERHQPQRVINLGTAGCINPAIAPGGTYPCTHFSQRDLLLGGCITGPAADALMAPIVTGTDGYRVNTGDNFVTDSTGIDADFVDMEAYAIARACQVAGIEFLCYKHISDRADSDAADQFQTNVHRGQRDYTKILADLGVVLIK